jgi:hypothetical protein
MMKFRFSARRTKGKTSPSSSSKRKSHPDSPSIPSDASATSSTSRTEESASKYEYGDGSPSQTSEVDVSKYGYEDCSPSEDIAAGSTISKSSSSTPRRSSMKGGAAEGNNDLLPRARRASIGYAGEIEVNLPGKREPVLRRTSISFCEEDQINEVVPMASLTDEPEALWFQDEEYANIKKKMRSIIHAAKRGESSTKKTYCTRGLEGHFGEGAESKGISRETGWDAVLREQYEQQNEGSFDDEGISVLYRLSSIESKIEAAQRATRDESDTEHYQKDTRRMMRRMSM